jgi:acyl dehydratase
MPISSAAVGRKINGGVTTEVTTRMMLAYAAGIGECSPRFFDDARPEGIVAPPSFCAALEAPINKESFLNSDFLNITSEEAIRIVRTGHDSVFYRAIRPGDKLHTTGMIIQIKQTSAGALVVQKNETVLVDTREPVVTSWISWIVRGTKVQGGDAEVESHPPLDLEPPASRALVVAEIFIPRRTPHIYAECSGIWNPINTQRKVALDAGLPDIILHGMATWSIAGREILKVQGENNPHRMTRFSAKFSSMIIPGATIRLLQGRCHSNPEVVYYRVENQQFEEAVSGFAFLETL